MIAELLCCHSAAIVMATLTRGATQLMNVYTLILTIKTPYILNQPGSQSQVLLTVQTIHPLYCKWILFKQHILCFTIFLFFKICSECRVLVFGHLSRSIQNKRFIWKKKMGPCVERPKAKEHNNKQAWYCFLSGLQFIFHCHSCSETTRLQTDHRIFPLEEDAAFNCHDFFPQCYLVICYCPAWILLLPRISEGVTTLFSVVMLCAAQRPNVKMVTW